MLRRKPPGEIEDQSGVIASGSGNELNEYVFGIPGNYLGAISMKILLSEPGSCSHNTCPDMINTINVSNVRMTFTTQKLLFLISLREWVLVQKISPC